MDGPNKQKKIRNLSQVKRTISQITITVIATAAVITIIITSITS